MFCNCVLDTVDVQPPIVWLQLVPQLGAVHSPSLRLVTCALLGQWRACKGARLPPWLFNVATPPSSFQLLLMLTCLIYLHLVS